MTCLVSNESVSCNNKKKRISMVHNTGRGTGVSCHLGRRVTKHETLTDTSLVGVHDCNGVTPEGDEGGGLSVLGTVAATHTTLITRGHVPLLHSLLLLLYILAPVPSKILLR